MYTPIRISRRLLTGLHQQAKSAKVGSNGCFRGLPIDIRFGTTDYRVFGGRDTNVDYFSIRRCVIDEAGSYTFTTPVADDQMDIFDLGLDDFSDGLSEAFMDTYNGRPVGITRDLPNDLFPSPEVEETVLQRMINFLSKQREM